MENDETIDLLAYLARLKRQLLPALAVGLAVAAALFLLGMRGGPMPEFQAKAHVLVEPAASLTPAETESEVQLLPQVLRTYVALEDVPLLVDEVSRSVENGKYPPEQVAEMTSIYWGGGSLLLAVNATAPSEEEAKAMAEAMAEALVKHNSEIIATKDNSFTMRLVEHAKVLTAAEAPKSNPLGTALPAGLAAALLTAVVLEWLASRRERSRRTTATR